MVVALACVEGDQVSDERNAPEVTDMDRLRARVVLRSLDQCGAPVCYRDDSEDHATLANAFAAARLGRAPE